MEEKKEMPEKPLKASFLPTPKGNVREFNKEELIGFVINRLNRVERYIDSIIIEHTQPDNIPFFQDVILNTSVISFGAKVKLLTAIGVHKNVCEKLRNFLAIRNGFAHSQIATKFNLTITNRKDKAPVVSGSHDGSEIHVMNAKGEVHVKIVEDYVKEYLELYKEITAGLADYITGKKPFIEI